MISSWLCREKLFVKNVLRLPLWLQSLRLTMTQLTRNNSVATRESYLSTRLHGSSEARDEEIKQDWCRDGSGAHLASSRAAAVLRKRPAACLLGQRSCPRKGTHAVDPRRRCWRPLGTLAPAAGAAALAHASVLSAGCWRATSNDESFMGIRCG
jgi:hypothetical protein